MTDIPVAIIGYGLAGRVFHAPLVAATPGLRVAAIVSRDPGRRAQAALDHPGAALLGDPDEVWARARELGLVVVATPNDAHAPLAAAAVDHGLPVLVDKPLAVSAAEARGLVAHARSAGVLLTVFQNRRYDADALLLDELLAAGTLGPVLRMESRMERWHPEPRVGAWRETTPPERGGGVLLDLASHLVDGALRALGPAAWVAAEIADRRGTGADDDAFLSITHRAGPISHIHASLLAAAPGPRLRVLGREGALVVPGVDGQEERLRAGERPGARDDWGTTPAHARPRLVVGERSVPLTGPPGDWPRFYAELRDALRGERAPPVDPEDAVAVLDLLELARAAAGERRALPVS